MLKQKFWNFTVKLKKFLFLILLKIKIFLGSPMTFKQTTVSLEKKANKKEQKKRAAVINSLENSIMAIKFYGQHTKQNKTTRTH